MTHRAIESNVEATCCSKSRNMRPQHSLVQRCMWLEISAPFIARQQLQDLPAIPLRSTPLRILVAGFARIQAFEQRPNSCESGYDTKNTDSKSLTALPAGVAQMVCTACHVLCVTPSGYVIILFVDPGCAARPWASE